MDSCGRTSRCETGAVTCGGVTGVGEVGICHSISVITVVQCFPSVGVQV